MTADNPRPLHLAYPTLAAKLAHVAIADLPTPLLDTEGPAGRVRIKADGLTHASYGGNKVRKLEYLFGQARRHNAEQVATFGAAGSNHATATAVHARALGLGCVNFLSRQRMTPWIAANLRTQLAAGARLVWVDGDRARRERQARSAIRASGKRTWLIPMGGSSCAGTLGYVDAALELAGQLDADGHRPPTAIYVPLGTMGTAVGLAIGLGACGLDVPVVAVRVVHESVGSAALAHGLFARTVRVLRTLDRRFPDLRCDDARLRVVDEYFGGGYAAATPAAIAAGDYAAEHWRLALETTYSAKTAAALLDDARAGAARARRPLFWATYRSAQAAAPAVAGDDPRVPEPLRPYLRAHPSR